MTYKIALIAGAALLFAGCSLTNSNTVEVVLPTPSPTPVLMPTQTPPSPSPSGQTMEGTRFMMQGGVVK